MNPNATQIIELPDSVGVRRMGSLEGSGPPWLAIGLDRFPVMQERNRLDGQTREFAQQLSPSTTQMPSAWLEAR